METPASLKARQGEDDQVRLAGDSLAKARHWQMDMQRTSANTSISNPHWQALLLLIIPMGLKNATAYGHKKATAFVSLHPQRSTQLCLYLNAGLGEGNEAKINVTAFLMTLDQATQFIASNFSRLAIARLGTVSQCVVNSESPGLCEKTVNGLDPDQTYFTFARD